MRRLFVFVALFALCHTLPALARAAEPPGDGRLRGAVVDQSGAVLPGVTVAVTSIDGRVLATTVSDGSGAFTVEGLPAEPVTVAFELEGFSPAALDVTVTRDAESRVPTQRLAL